MTIISMCDRCDQSFILCYIYKRVIYDLSHRSHSPYVLFILACNHYLVACLLRELNADAWLRPQNKTSENINFYQVKNGSSYDN